MMEEWRVIKDYPDYLVSNLGRIYSIQSIRLLKPQRHDQGYLGIDLCRNGKFKKHFIHRLVLESFVDKCPEGRECNHRNGTKADNRLENLEWVTPLENKKHARENGLYRPRRGETNGQSKLREADVIKIRKLYREGKHLQRELGKIFGVDRITINDVIHNRTWKHI